MSKPEETKVAEAFYTKLGISCVGIGSAMKIIELNRWTKTCVCMNGESGIGKTHIVRQIAAKRKPTKPFTWRGVEYTDSVPVITLFLAHMQPEDVGVPFPARAARTQLLQEADLLLRLCEQATSADDPRHQQLKARLDAATDRILANGFSEEDHFDFLLNRTFADMPDEGILFLDEWNRAEKQTVKAFFTIVEDRMIHGHKLPEGIQVITAMNPSDGSYMVNEAEKDHAIRKRLTFIAVTTALATWLEYASGKGNFHPYVVEFVRAMPGFLYDTKLRNAGKVFPCPATWEKVSDVLKAAEHASIPLSASEVETTIGGHVGEDAAAKLAAYIKDNEVVINPEDVIHNYTDKSKVRGRVRKLINQNRNDILDELCGGVAATLFSKKPDPEKIATPLARFMGDLHPEMAVSMVAHKFSANADEAEGGDAYLSELSRAMHTQPPYQKLFDRIAEAMRKAREQLGDGELLDPTQ
jgi:MoxR-like ATPase